jgi:hypothetical protein
LKPLRNNYPSWYGRVELSVTDLDHVSEKPLDRAKHLQHSKNNGDDDNELTKEVSIGVEVEPK